MKLLTHIAQYAVTTPDQIAFRNENQELTYNLLWEKSNSLANLIHAMDFKRQTPVVVYGHMGIDMPISFLGCVKAGHPYIPVDISIPMERVRLIVEKSGAGLVINTTDSVLDFDNVKVIQTNELELKQEEHISVEHWVKCDDIFYIIYTSGSTGNPKGVQISAANLESFTDWMTTDFPLN